MTTDPSTPRGPLPVALPATPSAVASERPPVGIPRAALERVFARAAELQAAQGDATDVIDEAQLLDIAREVGLDPVHMRQAMAEERARAHAPAVARGPMLEALGPAVVAVQRTVSGTPLEPLDRLDTLLPRADLLNRIRRFPDRVVWEPRGDLFSRLSRSLGVGGRRYDLVRTDTVSATATRIDDGRIVLRLEATLEGARQSERTTVVVVGLLLLLLLAMVGIPVTVLSLVVPSVAGVTVGLLTALAVGGTVLAWRAAKRSHRALVARVEQRLEALLDEVGR
jgi:hypothetical protein